MARNRQQIGERTQWFHRVWWGTVRVHPQYRRDVAAFLRRLRLDAGPRRPPRHFSRGVLSPTRKVRSEIRRKHPPPAPHEFPFSAEEFPVIKMMPDEAAREGLRAYRELLVTARSERWPALARPIGELGELGREFEAKWGLWFPIPPRVGGRIPRVVPFAEPVAARRAAASAVLEAVPDRYPRQFMSAVVAVPVRERHSDSSLLTLDVWLPAGKRVLDLVSGHLDLVQVHRWPGRPLLDPDTRRERMPPRKARKGAVPPPPTLRLLPSGWIRVSIPDPSSADGSEIQKLLRLHLKRAPFTLRTEEKHYGQIFLVCRELTRRASIRQLTARGQTGTPPPERRRRQCRLTRVEVARALALKGDAPDQALEQIAKLRRAYRHTCEVFRLPRPGTDSVF